LIITKQEADELMSRLVPLVREFLAS
jgi:hypothetical protein